VSGSNTSTTRSAGATSNRGAVRRTVALATDVGRASIQPRRRRCSRRLAVFAARATTRLISARNTASYVVMVGLAAVIGTLADAYTTITLARVLSLGLLAVSVAVLTGWAGLPSLGQVAPFAVGAYTAALLARAGHTVGVVQLAAASVAAGLFAALNGLVVVRTRGTAFLMVTLAVGELTAAVAARWASVTGGSDGLAGIPAVRPVWTAPLLTEDRHVYWYVLAVAALVVAVTVALLRSPAGLLLAGVRDHEARMRACGHPVTVYLLAAYAGAGAIAGVGGALLVSVQRYISPADVGFEVAALVLLAVIIGGPASIGGALFGAALIVATRDWLAGPWPGHAPLLLGAMFIATVYLLPDGLAGLVNRLSERAARLGVRS
jgi:branched-chain amino acid transport system permease protein